MVPLVTASAAFNAGTISPAAKVWIWNLLSVASPTALAIISAPPCSVSSDFGQLVVMRHLISGIDCAIAGAAMVAAPATPRPVTLMKSRRFIDPPWRYADSLRFEAWTEHGTSGSGFP